jgi:hypothetical protein
MFRTIKVQVKGYVVKRILPYTDPFPVIWHEFTGNTAQVFVFLKS